MIKAIFFDCDGTLLSHTSGTVRESTVQAFKQLREQGIRCILSTGRHVSELRDLTPVHVLSFDAYITLNGAYTYDAQRVLSSYPLEKEDIARVYSFLNENDLPIQFLEAEESYISSVNETVIRSQASIHTPVPKILPYERILEHPVYMLIPFGIKQAEPLIHSLNHVQATWWNHHDAIDVVHESAGKDRGMEAIMDAYGWKREETMAFGDAMNDLPMIRMAGIGVAMGNGEDALKKEADLVADDIDQDGLYHALVKLGILEDMR
ncbi:MAG: HAD family hydrolase [Solobacterium sp.]|nr:HAD family hydrolase [Solobacterium sp.]